MASSTWRSISWRLLGAVRGRRGYHCSAAACTSLSGTPGIDGAGTVKPGTLAAVELERWRARRATVLKVVQNAPSYDLKRAVFLANLAHLQYFDQHWHSRKPGGNDTLHPNDFSLPLQFMTGHASSRYGLPQGMARVEPASSRHDCEWSYEGSSGRVRNGVVFHAQSDTTGTFLTNKKRRWVVLAIRGSTSFSDHSTNMAFDHVDCRVPGATAAGCLTHRGFQHAYDSIAEGVVRTARSLFATDQYDRMFITGHSLGAALATHAALELTFAMGPHSHSKLAERIDVYTFGSPRVGNAAFVDFYDRHVPNTWRHVNDEDIVPLVPPTWAGYRHVGTLVHMNSNGIWVGQGSTRSIGVQGDGFALSETTTDHWMVTYKYMMRGFRAALYLRDDTSAALAQAFDAYLNSAELVYEVPTIAHRPPAVEGSAHVSPATYTAATKLFVPDQGRLVGVLNRDFGLEEEHVRGVLMEGERIAAGVLPLWHGQVSFDVFQLAFFNTFVEPHAVTRALSIAQAIALNTFKRFDVEGTGFLGPRQLEAFCTSVFGLDADMNHVYRLMEDVGLDPTGEVSFYELFLWRWIEYLRCSYLLSRHSNSEDAMAAAGAFAEAKTAMLSPAPRRRGRAGAGSGPSSGNSGDASTSWWAEMEDDLNGDHEDSGSDGWAGYEDVSNAQAAEDWCLRVSRMSAELFPFPTPEETTMLRVTTPGREAGTRIVKMRGPGNPAAVYDAKRRQRRSKQQLEDMKSTFANLDY